MKRLFTIFSLPLFALLTFFSLPTSHAEAECQIVPSGTHFRPEGTFNSYDDDNRPWVYVDVQTTGCVTSPSNVLKFQFFDTDTSTNPLSERFIQNVSVEIGDPGALTTNSDFKTSQDQFTLPILLGEKGVGDCNFDDNTNWAIFALNPALGALTAYFADIPDCMIFAKVVHVGTGQPIHSIGSVSSPKWIYECDYLCTTLWVVGGACAPNNEPLAYGPPNVCPQDTGLISNFTGLDQIDASQSATYSTDALAPLPGFSDNPDHLGVWLKSLFTILIVIAGILALIMIVVGGLTYMTSDAFGKKTQGRMYIINALSGLLLALGAWVVLNTINPDLASDLSISIPVVGLDGDAEYFPDQPISLGNGTVTSGTSLPTNLGLLCNGTGGSAAVPQIIDSFVNKTTYRWGAKGGLLPAGSSYPSSPNEGQNPYMCVDDNGQSVPCRTFCPSDSVCLDCSGFVNQVRRCAGLPYFNTGTHGMVAQALEIDMGQLSSNGQSIVIGGTPYTFVPGDILVWKGHVVIYYGDGKIAESEGTLQRIKNKNQNVIISPISKYRNRITHLIKVNP